MVGFGFAAHAESVPTTAKPEEVGLSSAQLKRIEEATAKNIDEELIPGAVMLVARRGKVAWVSVQGKREPDGDAMKYDSIFRIYSMTKPMVTHGADADGRGGPPAGQRPGVEVPALDRQDEGRHRGRSVPTASRCCSSPIRRGR